MSDQPRPVSRPRISLFGKIVAGFIIVIVIIMISSVTMLTGLQSAVSYDRSAEYRKLQLTLDLLDHLSAQQNIVQKLLRDAGPTDTATYAMFNRLYLQREDSLLRIDQSDAEVVDSIRVHHQRYDDFARGLFDRGAGADSVAQGAREAGLALALRNELTGLRDKYVSPVMRAQNALPKRMQDAIEYALIVLWLALALGIVLALLFARTLTRPIQALKAGTMKVGEGVYETVPVISNDEVADLTRAFNLMSEKLRQLDEMRMQMMSEISHEMRTPLQVIKAGCYSIIHTRGGPELSQRQRDAVGMIHQATNRINQFVNSFLDIAKMEAGLMKFNFDTLNLVEVITPLVQEAQLIAQTRSIELKCVTEEVGAIRLDKERLSQAFSNLLSNALKYTPEQGTIDVRVTKGVACPGVQDAGKGCIQIEVQDSGVGIPKADLEKLFEKFYQAKNTPLVNEKGSGLGLALVKHVAEAHGGTVSVASEVGKGSTFTILLPA
jgi:two-component system sensor histidine kinase GlrK